MKKIVITGVESSGKTTLAMALAEHFGVPFVPEMSRSYLKDIGLSYGQSDILKIAQLQLKEEEKHASLLTEYLICDTSLIVLKVWSLFKYGVCDPWILDQIDSQNWNLFLLPHFDIPFEPDELRENKNVREELYHMYLMELENLNVPFYSIKGTSSERLKTSVELIKLI